MNEKDLWVTDAGRVRKPKLPKKKILKKHLKKE
jgi:hypothetical protein